MCVKKRKEKKEKKKERKKELLVSKTLQKSHDKTMHVLYKKINGKRETRPQRKRQW